MHCLPLLEGHPLVAPFEDVLPLASLLAPVTEASRAVLSHALEAQLAPHTSARRQRSSSGAGDCVSNGVAGGPSGMEVVGQQQHMERGSGEGSARRALGPALQGLLEYLVSSWGGSCWEAAGKLLGSWGGRERHTCGSMAGCLAVACP